MSVSLFSICTDSKESRCASTHGEQGGQGQHAARQTGQHCPGPLQNFAVMEQKPMLHMHAAGWEVARQTLQGGCNPGAGPGEEKLAAVTQRKVKVLGPDSGRK